MSSHDAKDNDDVKEDASNDDEDNKTHERREGRKNSIGSSEAAYEAPLVQGGLTKQAQERIANEFLDDSWDLVRAAIGSLAGESWRLKQALVWPADAFELYPTPKDYASVDEIGWENFSRTQTFDNFKNELPFRPNTTNDVIDMVIVGDRESLEQHVHVDKIISHVQAFLGFRVVLRKEPLLLDSSAQTRQNPANPSQDQLAAHSVLAQLKDICNPLSVCTIAITLHDLYPPKVYEFVTGITDMTSRCAVYSVARYYYIAQLEAAPASQESQEVPLKQLVSLCVIKMLCRECCKLCCMRECRLMKCLMNPFPEGPAEAVRFLPLSFCCICLRKLQFMTQIDLLDRYARLPSVLSEWFADEVIWILERMRQIGMPTYVSLRNKNLDLKNMS